VELSVVQVGKSLVTGDVLVDCGDLLLVNVTFLTKLIHVVPECVGLLFGFDEGGDDLVDICHAGTFFDHVEGFLNNCGITSVLGQESCLLTVLVLDVFQANFHNFNRVIEFLVGIVSFVLLSIDVVLLDGVRLVAVLESFLQLLDLDLKLFLALLRLGLEGQNPVVVLAGFLRKHVRLAVRNSSSNFEFFNLFLHVLDAGLGEEDFFSHDVDFDLSEIVFANGVI